MSTLKSNLVRKKIGNKIFPEYESSSREMNFVTPETKKVVREKFYSTKGEILIVVKDINECNLILDSNTTEHIIIKALTKVIIKPSQNYIDEFYEEIQIEKGACVEFYLLDNNWYIVSSDGLKLG